MQKIQQYLVLRGQTETLIHEVNKLILEGWQPWGGFQGAGHDADFYGQQAMVRYGDVSPAAVFEQPVSVGEDIGRAANESRAA